MLPEVVKLADHPGNGLPDHVDPLKVGRTISPNQVKDVEVSVKEHRGGGIPFQGGNQSSLFTCCQNLCLVKVGWFAKESPPASNRCGNSCIGIGSSQILSWLQDYLVNSLPTTWLWRASSPRRTWAPCCRRARGCLCFGSWCQRCHCVCCQHCPPFPL